MSVDRVMARKTKSPYCHIRGEAKMKQVYHRWSAFHRPTEAWGDISTMGRIDSKQRETLGRDDTREALVKTCGQG